MLKDYFTEYADSLTSLEEITAFRDYLQKRYVDYAYGDDIDEDTRIALYEEFAYVDDMVDDLIRTR